MTAFWGNLGKICHKTLFFGNMLIKKSREESGTSQLGTNTLQGLLIITDVINIMKLTNRACFWVFSAKKSRKSEIFGI